MAATGGEGGAGARRIEMFQIDAFTDRVFGGNPAAVAIDAGDLSPATMQAVAAENNLSETAFARSRTDGGYDLRWFTPTREANFCGHATLATAHALAAERGLPGPFVFHTRVGRLVTTRVGTRYALDLPALEPEPIEDAATAFGGRLAAMFGRPPLAAFRNFENVFALLPDEEAVARFVPDLPAIAGLGPLGLAVTARGADVDFVSRYFAPAGGIPEDPATGSTHATLVPYWARRLGKDRLTARQLSRRGADFACALADGRVTLVGGAVTFMRATILVPAD